MKVWELISLLLKLDQDNEVVGWGPPDYVDDGDGRMDNMGSNTVCHVKSVDTHKGMVIIDFEDEVNNLKMVKII